MPGKQLDTPTKARIKGAIKFLKYKSIPFKKRHIFDYFRVSKRIGHRLLADDSTSYHTRHNNLDLLETRGRKRKIDKLALDSIKSLYDTEGFEAKRLPLQSLAIEVGVDLLSDPSTCTIY